jgi:hypothetical protein
MRGLPFSWRNDRREVEFLAHVAVHFGSYGTPF